jgi:Tat protein translocase TatC
MNDPRDRRERLIIDGFKIFILLFVAFALGTVSGRFFTLAFIDDYLAGQQLLQNGTILVGDLDAALNRISFLAGLVFEIPLVIYLLARRQARIAQIPRLSRRYAVLIVVLAAALFIAGAMFARFVVLVFTLKFLTEFSPPDIVTSLSVSSFADFVIKMMLAVGLMFETPLVIFLLVRHGVLQARTFRRLRRYAIVVIAILAAVITPTPDPFTMMLVGIPMYLLYELGVLLARRVAPTPDDEPELADTDSAGATA